MIKLILVLLSTKVLYEAFLERVSFTLPTRSMYRIVVSKSALDTDVSALLRVPFYKGVNKNVINIVYYVKAALDLAKEPKSS